jgi:hypothetical protein
MMSALKRDLSKSGSVSSSRPRTNELSLLVRSRSDLVMVGL